MIPQKTLKKKTKVIPLSQTVSENIHKLRKEYMFGIFFVLNIINEFD